VKEQFAAIIDSLDGQRNATESGDKKRMYSAAITEAQVAQMWAVKAITCSTNPIYRMEEVVTAKYKITGLVEDTAGVQGNSNGQFEVGSVQELPLEVGAKCVEAGTCELVEDETAEESNMRRRAGTGETGEQSNYLYEKNITTRAGYAHKRGRASKGCLPCSDGFPFR